MTFKKLLSRFSVISLAILILVTSTGCGGNSSGGKVSKGDGNSALSGLTLTEEEIESLRGTTVKYATWKNPEVDEDGPVVKSFKEKYGINVEIVPVKQAGYSMTIAGMIASGNAPDVYFSTVDFPSYLNCVQPIENSGIDVTDSFWDQSLVEWATIGGKTYIVNSAGSIWADIDCLYYNKPLLENNNIATPDAYIEAGQWNYKALEKIMTDVKNLGSSYTGGAVMFESMLSSTNNGFYNWNPKTGKFENGINDSLHSVMQTYADWYKKGLIKTYKRNSFMDFTKGNVGICITNCYGLKKTGFFKDMDVSSIGFAPLPDVDENNKAVISGICRGYGLIKGSKNPKAAGLFLRHYLDIGNYDTTSAFISGDAEAFFFQLTGADMTDKYTYSYDGIQSVTKAIFDTTFVSIATMEPSQVSQKLSSLNNVVEDGVKTLNELVAKKIDEDK